MDKERQLSTKLSLNLQNVRVNHKYHSRKNTLTMGIYCSSPITYTYWKTLIIRMRRLKRSATLRKVAPISCSFSVLPVCGGIEHFETKMQKSRPFCSVFFEGCEFCFFGEGNSASVRTTSSALHNSRSRTKFAHDNACVAAVLQIGGSTIVR